MPMIANIQYTTWEEKCHHLLSPVSSKPHGKFRSSSRLFSFYRHSKLLRNSIESKRPYPPKTNYSAEISQELQPKCTEMKHSQIIIGKFKRFEKQDSHSAFCPNHSSISYSICSPACTGHLCCHIEDKNALASDLATSRNPTLLHTFTYFKTKHQMDSFLKACHPDICIYPLANHMSERLKTHSCKTGML